MGSGWSFELESPLDRNVFNVIEEHTYLDEFSPEDAGFEDWDDLSKKEQQYYYEEWKEEFYQGALQNFKEKCMKHLDDFIEAIQQAKEYQDEMNEYAEGGSANSPQKSFLSEKQLKKYNHEKVGHIDFYYKKGQNNRHSGMAKEVYFKDGFRPSFAVSFSNEPKEVYESLKSWAKAQKKNFDDIIAVKYAEGGEAGYSKKERVIDYYYQNDIFDDYETYGLSEDDLNNEDKVVKSIIKYHGLNKPENVEERFETLGLEDFEEEYAEGGEVEDWMEEALASLIEETGYDDLEITIVSNDGNEFYATDENAEYRVFKTEDDAEETAIQQVREDLEENPEYFNQDWLMNYIDGRDFFEQELNEMNYSYVEDIASETDSKYANRLIDELVENGIMDEDDAESENAEELADELKYDYVLLLTEDKLGEGNDGLDYFINNFGEQETYKMVVDNNLIDIDEASKDAVSTDGIGHFLSSYDGETLYLSDDCVAYRIN
jgi:hypothetical protein